MRTPLIAANWKMYKTPAEALSFLRHFLPLIKSYEGGEVVIFPPMTSLVEVLDASRGSRVAVGGQTMHWLNEGAYTGETSPTQLLALGCTHVLIGHSERRQYFNETDTTVNLKLKAALAQGLVPVVCVGEHLAERESGRTEDVLELQVSIALEGVDPATAGPLVIAYEPVWAIGTGRTATPEIAEETHKIIRRHIAKALGAERAAATRILYGGSVKPDNAHSLCCLEDIDGALVGGASLAPVSFTEILRAAARK